jgi:hypothetical protein
MITQGARPSTTSPVSIARASAPSNTVRKTLRPPRGRQHAMHQSLAEEIGLEHAAQTKERLVDHLWSATYSRPKPRNLPAPHRHMTAASASLMPTRPLAIPLIFFCYRL